ncbi:MAG: molybdopterin oxidoreductase [Dehalococcoidia bacterium]|nr:MAG: molybdopterin oxidoreductase [Dehalococcoidia bacterium]
MDNKIIKTESANSEFNRRDFLKISALLGGSALLAGCNGLGPGLSKAERENLLGDVSYELAKPENIIYSVCQQCNTQCGIKVKIIDGVASKIDGNPYSPWTMMPHLDYKTPIASAAPVDGAICPKGHATLQTAYDPYRLVKVLKRTGPRGSNKWATIPFDQAITEIVNGGKLFNGVPGEENRVVSGLKDVWALRDANVMKAMAADVKTLLGEKDPVKKRDLISAFKVKYKDNLDKLIDPEHPDLGPKNNQFNFMWGRLKAGRSNFITRFTNDGMGSVNAHGHTTVCQGSLYFSGKAMSEQFNSASNTFTGGAKAYWQADTANSEFIIFAGASPFEGNYGPPFRVPRLTNGLADGRLKFVVFDPRLSKTAAKAWKWLPNIPGSEAAVALAMIRWIIENKRYDSKYLANANKAAATADGEPSWSNAPWLVLLDTAGLPTRFLRASDLGLPKEPFTFDPFVVLKGGTPVAFDPNDTKTPAEGDLLVSTEISGKKVKSSLQILWESASSKTMEEWSKICGIKGSDLEETAREFTSHGKKAAADIHRGISQHTNGFYNVISWYSLNLLIGNYDWQGGMIQLSAYDTVGAKAAGPFNLNTMRPGVLGPFGISVIRHDVKYETTSLYLSDGYPAKRNWYPLASDLYQEQITSAGDGYPYGIKVLFIYMGSPIYSVPAGNKMIEILADPTKIPLVVASDIIVGETSMYADYIFPDISNLERWEFSGSHPSIPFKVQGIRQPAIAPLVETVTVYGKQMPLSLEALLLASAEKLGLPTFGANGQGEGIPLTHQDDYYLRMVADLAFGEKADGSDAVPDADDEEVRLFIAARSHLPKTVFDSERWKAIVGEKHWRKVVYVLNRGGRFQEFAKGYPATGLVGNPYGKLINLYQEKTAGVKNSQTGKSLIGYPAYIPAPLDITGKPVEDEKLGYDLTLITFREISQTKSRTPGNYWLSALLPENHIVMNQQDATRLGLKTGEQARIVSASNPEGVWDLMNGQKVPIAGKVKVVEGIRPGVIAFSLGHGHWAYGGVDITIDGQVIEGDGRRVRGFHANASMRVDPYLKNTCLSDPVGGSCVFYDSRVKVEKVK